MPYAKEVARLRVAQTGCAEESKRSAIVVSGNHFSELGVLNAERSSRVLGFRPVQTAIMRYGDLGMAVRVHIAEIDCVVFAGGDRWIAAGANSSAIGNCAHTRGTSVVTRIVNAWG